MTRDEAIKAIKTWDFLDNNEKKVIETLIPELAESEDERIRKAIIEFFELQDDNTTYSFVSKKDILAWLEKQGVHANFRNKIQVGDKVTRNEDGVLVNMSQFKRLAKPRKLVDKVEPKFHKGDWIVNNTTLNLCHILKVEHGQYICDDCSFPITKENEYHLWTIQDAKDGDVLSFNDGHGNDCIELIKSITDKKIEFWFCLTNGNRYEVFDGITPYTNLASREDATPATKEQRDTLMKAMTDAGWEFDFDKKELKKIEDEEYNGEDYGIDSLFHAQRILEKTLGKVDGYQSDDGILEHKCAITAIKKLYKQKPDWREEDEMMIEETLYFLREYQQSNRCKDENGMQNSVTCENWLKSLRDKVLNLANFVKTCKN